MSADAPPTRTITHRRRSPGSRARARMHVRVRDGEVDGRRSCGSTSRRGSSRRSCAGRRYTEPPDITARICGICPVAYQMSACTAIEDACGVDGRRADPRAAPPALLRRVDREPRAARLHAARARLPRLRERRSRWPRDHREVVERGLRLKKAGNEIDGGGRRARDPPGQRAGRRLLPRARRARELARARASARAGARGRARDRALGRRRSTFPDFEQDYEFVALRRAGRVPDRARPAACRARGLDIAPGGVRRALRRGARRALERAARAPASTAGSYLVGPLGPLHPQLRPALAGRARGGRRGRARARSCRNPFQSIVVRAVEILYALDEALRIIDALRAARAARRRGATPRAGVGLRLHRGAARDALPPLRARRRRHDRSTPRSCRPPRRTSAASRTTCAAFVERARSTSPTTSCALRCEQAIRNYDPCISCATHFLQLEVDRE